MALPQDYWASFETTVGSLSRFVTVAQTISRYQAATGTRFAWRGVADADWPLHSALVRRYIKRFRAFPSEAQLRALEQEVIDEARAWNLDWHAAGGRLSALELLAAMQHFEVPSRMLDFTFNPMIALWFAVEKHDERPGRVFAVDIAGRQVSPSDAVLANPWWLSVPAGTVTSWATQAWVWTPPPLEPRIARQEACFVMGGIPSTFPARNVRKGTGWRLLRADEIRECMSLPFQLITYGRASSSAVGGRPRGPRPKASAFTVRIDNKEVIRRDLEQAFGYSPRSLFPDIPGLRRYGKSFR
jgi:hypothetical protein